MQIIIKNCNCLDEAIINVDEGKLNIKYGMNGTGKSTISKAIELNIKGGDKLKSLMPFKFIGKELQENYFPPSVTGAENIKSIGIFNEEYINQFVFKPDEVVSNSFDIFVRNPEYDAQMQDIENAFKEIKETFKKNEYLDQVIKDLSELSDCFGKSESGYSKAGALHKGVGSGNKIENVPKGLEPYSVFLKSPSNVKWLKWQINGKEFLDISSECPYCIAPTTEEKKEQIKLVGKEYDSKTIEHLNKILEILENLSGYFSEETNQNLLKITKNKSTISDEEISYLKEIKNNVDLLKNKLTSLRDMSFFSFKDVDKVMEKITDLKIKIEFLPKLDSPKTRETVDSTNTTLDIIIAKAEIVQRAIGIQKSSIKKTTGIYKEEINTFLKYAGYKYHVDIEDEQDVYKMKLKHKDFTGNLQNGTQHLSYGEKNAFSLVLFMYECIRENPDLIVLDDPISSFDRNKKFAILEKLFRRDKSFKDRTVLMMTHDLEPIIDMIHSLSGKFHLPKASFLEAKNGKVVEVPITKQDIVTFSQVCSENVASACDDIIKLIYLRRHFEVINDKSSTYQLLSNIFHKREIPMWVEYSQPERNMSPEEIADGTAGISKFITQFNYGSVLKRIVDEAQMLSIYKAAQNNYEKLQLFRIINKNKQLHQSEVIAKYINEAFHIENEYLMQLNPNKYETTPSFIVAECDKSLFPAVGI